MRRVWVGAILLALAGGIYLGVASWRPSGPGPTATAAYGEIRQVVAATGRVEPWREVTLANRIPGRIRAVLVEEGDTVRKDQPLVLFDAPELEAQVKTAEAQVATAEATRRQAETAVETARARWAEVKSGARPQEVERARAELAQAQRAWENADRERGRLERLWTQGLIARADLDRGHTEAEIARARVRAAEEALSLTVAGPKPESVEAAWAQVRQAEAQVAQAEAQVRQARAQLDYAKAVLENTVLTSTLAGVVTHKLVEPGEAVDIGVPLLILADARRSIVKVEVDETDVGKLALGQEAVITSDAFPGREFRGRVIEFAPAVGKRSIRPENPAKIGDLKILQTKVELTSARELRLGMTVDARILVVHKARALVIPRKATGAGPDGVVRVVDGSATHERKVRLGLRDDERVEVLEGLREGERVLLGNPR